MIDRGKLILEPEEQYADLQHLKLRNVDCGIGPDFSPVKTCNPISLHNSAAGEFRGFRHSFRGHRNFRLSPGYSANSVRNSRQIKCARELWFFRGTGSEFCEKFSGRHACWILFIHIRREVLRRKR